MYTSHTITNELKLYSLIIVPPLNLSNLKPFLFGSQRRWSLSLPVLTLIFPALLPCLVRDSLCTALQTKILWINWSLNAIDTMETWVSGNLTALTERSQPAIRWTRGRGGRIVCLGSFRGGHWYLPIRNHDNSILLIGLGFTLGYRRIQKTWTAVQSPTRLPVWLKLWEERSALRLNYNRNRILPRRSSRLYKGKLIKMRPKWTKMDRE